MRTKEQTANLNKLANYLLALPELYSNFTMASYYKFQGVSDNYNLEVVRGLEFSNTVSPNNPFDFTACGTVGCAVGHGPLAGVEVLWGDISWHSYSRRVFTKDLTEWDWCFSPDWSFTDNSPRGAGIRIKALLAGYDIGEEEDLFDDYDREDLAEAYL